MSSNRFAMRAARLVQRRAFRAGAAAGESATAPRLAFAALGASAAAAAFLKPSFVSADEGGDAASLESRVRDLEVAEAGRMSSAFVFIKPHAVTDDVKALVKKRFSGEGIGIKSEGRIAAERIDQELLIDTHYGAIASRAMKQKPSELVVQQAAKDEFKKAFGLSWEDALTQGVVYNLADGAAKLQCTLDEVGGKYDKLTKGVDMLKFGGGFYCGKVDGIYVINGFYAKMRSQFTVPGEAIYYYEVEWDSNRLDWASFRGQVLGGTDPKDADGGSLRHAIYKGWKDLGLTAEPNTGNNGMHASASPFEAMSERNNWLSVPLTKDYYGRAMLALGIPLHTIAAWTQDPAVVFGGKRQSLFDLLEDINGNACLKKSVDIAQAN